VEEEGPMTQEQVGQYLGVTKEWISQIEKSALKKLRQAMGAQGCDTWTNEPTQFFTPKTVWYTPQSLFKYLDAKIQFSTEDPVLPYTWRKKKCAAK
jgi:transcriptional regulator with XRE-family HTH domain